MAPKLLHVAAAVGAVALTVASAPAWSHQIASNNGVSVQVHVNPNDEPIAGEATTVWVVRVKALNAIFAWKTCRCRMTVFDSSGTVVLNSNVTVPKTPVTFPEAKAYGITFSGRVKRKGIWRTFKVSYAIRATALEPPPSDDKEQQ
jgi:hypothetical protein